MAITINAKGTSASTFKIGKKGTTLHQGQAVDPNIVPEGAFWFDSLLGALRFKGTDPSSWKNLVFDDISFLNNSIISVSGEASISLNGDVVLNPGSTGSVKVGSDRVLTVLDDGTLDAATLNGSSDTDFLMKSETGQQILSGDIIISGDLTVNGNTDVVQRDISTGENTILLNADWPSGTNPTENAGIFVYRGNTGQDTTGIAWDEGSDQWKVSIRSGVDPTDPDFPTTGGGTLVQSYDIYHEGNKPTPADIGAEPSHAHPYLPLTGGELSGNLLIETGTNTDAELRLTEAGKVHGAYFLYEGNANALHLGTRQENVDTLYATVPRGSTIVDFKGSPTVNGVTLVKTDDSRLSDTRAPTSHTHPYSEITGTHTHPWSEVTGKPASYASADKWTTDRTITLSGDLSGNVSINGAADVTLSATVKDDSHAHTAMAYQGNVSNSGNFYLDRGIPFVDNVSVLYFVLCEYDKGQNNMNGYFTNQRTSGNYAFSQVRVSLSSLSTDSANSLRQGHIDYVASGESGQTQDWSLVKCTVNGENVVALKMVSSNPYTFTNFRFTGEYQTTSIHPFSVHQAIDITNEVPFDVSNSRSIIGGKLNVVGEVTAPSFNTSSSLRYKEGIVDLDYTNEFDKLRPVSYNRKDNGKAEIGFIAEEVNELIPEVVHKVDDVVEGIDYSRLTAVLTAKVQQQDDTIYDQAVRIDELEEKIYEIMQLLQKSS